MRTAYPISAVTALVSVALTACSGGDTSRPDTTTHTATISMAQALASVEELSAVDAPAGQLADLVNGAIPPAVLDVLRVALVALSILDVGHGCSIL